MGLGVGQTPSILHAVRSGDDPADLSRVSFAGPFKLFQERLPRIGAARDDQADAHVERPPHVILGHVARSLQPLEDGGTRHRERSMRAAVPAGRIRGRLSVMPPPVMCAIPLMRPDGRSGRMSGRYERCGSSRAAPTVAPSSATCASTRRPAIVEHDPTRQRIAVGMQARGRHTNEHVARPDPLAVD